MAQKAILDIKRFFTRSGEEAYAQLQWVKTDSKITNQLTGETVFEQKEIEFPVGWSLNAINIVAQKYFAGTPQTAGREKSLKGLIDRVVETVTKHGQKEGYFADKEEAEAFRQELKFICATQRAAFNSPVWFNIGVPSRRQQSSACFILAVEDDMRSILNWFVEEGLIFKHGSGAGINISTLRSKLEPLSQSGGMASGPVSFMRGADASAGAIRSGGKTRRSAKMVILNINHPDIEEFIWTKAVEERKSRILADAGFDMGIDGADAFSVQYQNANNSVRVSDDFMEAVTKDQDWLLKAVNSAQTVKTVKAKDLYYQIAQAAWECADPGIQFDTTINDWHTTPSAGRINASNPCSEYMHLDNSACNLASINLLKYLRDDGQFDIEAFKHTVEVLITAQEILVGYSSYPTEKITRNALRYRQLGLGYANLGGLLMARGLAYDSDEGRAWAAAITALMTGTAYVTSAKLAKKVGPFAGYARDEESLSTVLKNHRQAIIGIDVSLVPEELISSAAVVWDEALELNSLYGVRNSQVTLLAPTGTIGLMMDCDTTGIEPDLSLIKFKKLVGGGTMQIVNQTIDRALQALGYDKPQIKEIIDHIDEQKTIIGAPYLKSEHYSIFATSIGENAIHYLGHIKMMAAVQPFLSGAISKTVNLPESATVEEIEELHTQAWKMGLKSIAIYRDNCKVAQPLSSVKKEDDTNQQEPISDDSKNEQFMIRSVIRRELPRIRNSKTFKFSVADVKGYFTVGQYDDGTPGEIFMSVSKQGSTLAGIMDALAISISHGLQYGVPLKSYVKTFINMNFAPSGMTDDEEIRTASSLVDYIFRRLAKEYLSFEDRLELGLATLDEIDISTDQASLPIEEVPSVKSDLDSNKTGAGEISQTSDLPPLSNGQARLLAEDRAINPTEQLVHPSSAAPLIDAAAPICANCGSITQRAGNCYVCPSCGMTTGCS